MASGGCWSHFSDPLRCSSAKPVCRCPPPGRRVRRKFSLRTRTRPASRRSKCCSGFFWSPVSGARPPKYCLSSGALLEFRHLTPIFSPIEVEGDAGAAAGFGRQTARRKFTAKHEHGIADFQLGVHDPLAVGSHEPADFLRAESLLV